MFLSLGKSEKRMKRLCGITRFGYFFRSFEMSDGHDTVGRRSDSEHNSYPDEQSIKRILLFF